MAEKQESELQFMYRKYEQLCFAYQELAKKINSQLEQTSHDMSHMTFDKEE